jgi:hypothetical protein
MPPAYEKKKLAADGHHATSRLSYKFYMKKKLTASRCHPSIPCHLLHHILMSPPQTIRYLGGHRLAALPDHYPSKLQSYITGKINQLCAFKKSLPQKKY